MQQFHLNTQPGLFFTYKPTSGYPHKDTRCPTTDFQNRIYSVHALEMHSTQHQGEDSDIGLKVVLYLIFKKPKDAATRESGSSHPFCWSAKLVSYLTHPTGNLQVNRAETWRNTTPRAPENESHPTSPGTTGNLLTSFTWLSQAEIAPADLIIFPPGPTYIHQAGSASNCKYT